jgi:Fe-S-cluster containining protein
MGRDDTSAQCHGQTGELEINDDILCRIDLLKSLQETFECRRCGECCCSQEAIAFTESDLQRASISVSLTPMEFKEKFGLRLIDEPGQLVFYQLPTNEIGACPFYSDHFCSIYDSRPLVCQGFPFLTPQNVQSAFEMKNAIQLGGRCKAAIDHAKRTFEFRPSSE